jgi:3'(2'), 5'-bisphosphate nucleotidase
MKRALDPSGFSDRDTMQKLLVSLTSVAVAAARVILAHDPRTIETHSKDDASPVTRADVDAEAVIVSALGALVPGVPILSEERPFDMALLSRDWLFAVDPLDGTKEFLAGNGEYAVSIGLLRKGVPVAGVIAAPAKDTVWRGATLCGAEKLSFTARFDAKADAHAINTAVEQPGDLTVLTSRSHLDAPTAQFVASLKGARHLQCGSALKFGCIAEGQASLYPRFGPTCFWDIAAGHAIVHAAGGCMATLHGGPLNYADCGYGIRIPSFVAWGDPSQARDISQAA